MDVPKFTEFFDLTDFIRRDVGVIGAVVVTALLLWQFFKKRLDKTTAAISELNANVVGNSEYTSAQMVAHFSLGKTF